VFVPDVAKQLAKPGYLAGSTKALRQSVNVPVIISGRIVSPILAEKIIQNEEADIIGLGRPLLTDADWIRKARTKKKIIGCRNCNMCFKNLVLGESVTCDRWPKVVQDRIKLETRFSSRHGYRTKIVFSCISDLEIARNHIQQRDPIHRDIFDRQLFLYTGEVDGYKEATKNYMAWSDQYLRTHLKRGKIENYFLDDFQDPVDVIMEHLKDNFGFVSFFHDKKSKCEMNDIQIRKAH
jgi:tRNA-dihydrouridine synthase